MGGGKKVLLLGAILIAVLLLGIGMLLLSNSSLQKQITGLTASTKNLETNLGFLQEKFDVLVKENKRLKEENSRVISDSTSLQEKMGEVEIEVEKTLDQLTEFENTVKDSIAWFKRNVNIKDNEKYAKVRQDLEQCISYTGACTIDLKCIHNVNEENEFEYKLDEETSDKDDFLQDLDKVFDNQGGDCEDISLLYRAEYNYLLDTCLANHTRNDITLKTGEQEIKNTYMYIVCGTWDPEKVVNEWGGHCMVALTKEPILDNEPQNAQFEGEMGKSASIKVFDNGVAPDTLHYIYFVITEKDLLIFYTYSDEINWMGYQDFLSLAQDLREKVEI